MHWRVRISLACVGATVALCAWLDPLRSPSLGQSVVCLCDCIAVPLMARRARQVASLQARLRGQLSRLDLSGVAAELKVTVVSAGWVELAADDTLEAAIERTEQALYRVKTRGRNRTESG